MLGVKGVRLPQNISLLLLGGSDVKRGEVSKSSEFQGGLQDLKGNKFCMFSLKFIMLQSIGGKMLDPGFPACPGSLKTKPKLLLSLFKACQQTTSIGRDKHNILLYYYCFQQKMSDTRSNALDIALRFIMMKVPRVIITRNHSET